MRVLQIRTEQFEPTLERRAGLNPMTVLVTAQTVACCPIQVTVRCLLAEEVMESGAIDGHIAHWGEELRPSEERDVVMGVMNHC